jgi:hypothetical protein
MAESWSADVPISMPEGLSPNNPGLVPMFGFTFTENGLAHDITTGEVQELSIPKWAPPMNPNAPEVKGDADFRYGLGE